MLDLDTLRIAQAAVAAVAFALVFFGTYRPTRAPYAGWWSAVVILSGAATAMYLLAPVTHQVVAESAGNALSVVGAALVWGAARSLRTAITRWWHVSAPGVAVFAVSLLDLWREGTPIGTAAMLAAMSLYLGISARELWTLAGRQLFTASHERYSGTGSGAVSMAAASSIGSGFYVLRFVVYLTAGPSSDLYITYTGPAATTLLVILLLLVVSYTVTELSQFELTAEWRERAMRDDLTGLLNRSAFTEQAEMALRKARVRRDSFAVVMADFDHFKAINDAHGHAEGDRTLIAFGDACREVLGNRDLACRLGGEEFVMLLVDADAARARAVTKAVSENFADGEDASQLRPTISYGIALGRQDAVLRQLMERADKALYQAKDDGRDRTVIDGSEQQPTGTV